MPVPLSRLAPIALCLSAIALFNAPTASFANDSFGLPPGKVVLQPADAQGNEVPGPGYFEVTANAGSSAQLYALVGNVGKKKMTVSIVPVDAKSGVYGGVSYGLPQQHRKHVGAWLKLSMSRVLIHPGRAAVVPFSLSVPAKTKPGQYVGGLTAYVPAHKSKASQAKRGKGGAIILQLRRIVAVVVTVPGASFGRLKLAKVNAKQRPDAVYLIAHIRNTGTTLLKGTGHLWMWKQGVKQPIMSVPLTLDTTVPRTTVLYPILWAKHPQKGTYRVTATVSWEGGGKSTQRSKIVWPAAK
jgi:hypothetical protein